MSIPVLTGFDHVGIRVVDRQGSLRFYEGLGFHVDARWSNENVAEVVTGAGLRLNLIFNGEARPDGKNVLLDLDPKRPGYTHAAFTVESIEELIGFAAANGIPITEGPVDWGRRITCFFRDPDGNVLEFNEIKPVGGG